MRRALVGGELDEGFDRVARALGGAGLDDLASEHEEGDDAGGLVIAGGERSEDGDGDELVDAQVAAAQVLDGGDDDGITEDERADHGAGAGEGAAGVKEPVHHEGVEDADDAKGGPRNGHDRMLMVVAAAAIVTVLVLAD